MKESSNAGMWAGARGQAKAPRKVGVAKEPEAAKVVRVAVDGMGGDYAPAEIVKGSVQAARDLRVEIFLTGPRKLLEAELAGIDTANLPVHVIDAPDVITDDEHPILAVMRKPKNSVAVAAKLVKEGKADAMMSAGSTGALMLCAYQYLGTLPGVDRPIIGGPFIQFAPDTFVLDMGANVGCQSSHMLNFAVTGSVFVKKFLGIDQPTVGLLNVGTEEGKGNEVVKEAYSLLKESGLNFIGNVEGMAIPQGGANVIVCDGFVGNIMLKFSEGLGKSISQWLTQELSGKISASEVKRITTELMKLVSPAESAGGAPIWGIDGVAVIGHGSSRAEQIVACIKEAKLAVESDFIGTLREELEKAQKIISANNEG
ncbi:MAG: phosphate acyltransferase PlsX [Dehalococcoidia bacterium]|nr:phosphate acyltransferase PlsX [Dehalococcoidia bacterium]